MAAVVPGPSARARSAAISRTISGRFSACQYSFRSKVSRAVLGATFSGEKSTQSAVVSGMPMMMIQPMVGMLSPVPGSTRPPVSTGSSSRPTEPATPTACIQP